MTQMNGYAAQIKALHQAVLTLHNDVFQLTVVAIVTGIIAALGFMSACWHIDNNHRHK